MEVFQPMKACCRNKVWDKCQKMSERPLKTVSKYSRVTSESTVQGFSCMTPATAKGNHKAKNLAKYLKDSYPL